jgi:hypothetical protein
MSLLSKHLLESMADSDIQDCDRVVVMYCCKVNLTPFHTKLFSSASVFVVL